jgi:adenine-specific DNA-methyltransferase
LCPLIFREIDRVLPRRLWAGRTFMDGFLGGGSVSLYAKAQGFKVVSCDIAERALMTGRALIENSRTKITREDVIRILTPNPEPPMRVEREMCPAIFTANGARFIDRALAVARVSPDPAKALLRLLAVRVALLSHPMSQVRKGTIHRVTTGEFESITNSCLRRYVDDALRLTRLDRVWPLAEQINAGVFQGEGRVLQASVLDVLPTIEADVAYFDPPYPGVMSYEREYRVIDDILEGASRPTSPFTSKDGAAMIDQLFERAQHIPVWLLSLGNAVVTIDELAEKMRRLGRRTKAIEIKYQHLPSIATEEKNASNREFLVVGWDPAAAWLRDRGRDGPLIGAGEESGDLTVALDQDQHVAGATVSSPSGLARDPDHQMRVGLGFVIGSTRGGPIREELDDPVDGPLPLTDEPRLHDHVEVRAMAQEAHGGTVQPAGFERHAREE